MMNWKKYKIQFKKFFYSGNILWALALPPRYNDIQWKGVEDLQKINKSYEIKKIKESYSLSQRDIGHSAQAYFYGNKIAIPNVGGFIEYFDTSRRTPQSNPQTIPNSKHGQLFQFKDKEVLYHDRGKYEIEMDEGNIFYYPTRSSKENLWKTELNQNLISVRQQGESSELWMLSYKDPKLMFLSWGRGRESQKSVLHRVEWKDDVLPLFLEYCARREVTFIDKSDSGEFTLYDFFERDLNGPFPKFQLSLNKILPEKVGEQSPEIYQALVANCHKLYLIGNFGIIGVEY